MARDWQLSWGSHSCDGPGRRGVLVLSGCGRCSGAPRGRHVSQRTRNTHSLKAYLPPRRHLALCPQARPPWCPGQEEVPTNKVPMTCGLLRDMLPAPCPGGQVVGGTWQHTTSTARPRRSSSVPGAQPPQPSPCFTSVQGNLYRSTRSTCNTSVHTNTHAPTHLNSS